MPDLQTVRDEDYLAWVRDQGCAVCTASSLSDPHHLDSGVMGSKGDDWTALPMCRACHREYHDIGHNTFEKRHYIDLWKEAHRHL
jgi:hypothetical protein